VPSYELHRRLALYTLLGTITLRAAAAAAIAELVASRALEILKALLDL
jgi:hypothetical protein